MKHNVTIGNSNTTGLLESNESRLLTEICDQKNVNLSGLCIQNMAVFLSISGITTINYISTGVEISTSTHIVATTGRLKWHIAGSGQSHCTSIGKTVKWPPANKINIVRPLGNMYQDVAGLAYLHIIVCRTRFRSEAAVIGIPQNGRVSSSFCTGRKCIHVACTGNISSLASR